MQEIRCPKCGEVFQVDESGYAAIVRQVRDSEFGKEIRERTQQFELDKKNAVKLAVTEAASKKEKELLEKDREIAELRARI